MVIVPLECVYTYWTQGPRAHVRGVGASRGLGAGSPHLSELTTIFSQEFPKLSTAQVLFVQEMLGNFL